MTDERPQYLPSTDHLRSLPQERVISIRGASPAPHGSDSEG